MSNIEAFLYDTWDNPRNLADKRIRNCEEPHLRVYQASRNYALKRSTRGPDTRRKGKGKKSYAKRKPWKANRANKVERDMQEQDERDESALIAGVATLCKYDPTSRQPLSEKCRCFDCTFSPPLKQTSINGYVLNYDYSHDEFYYNRDKPVLFESDDEDSESTRWEYMQDWSREASEDRFYWDQINDMDYYGHRDDDSSSELDNDELDRELDEDWYMARYDYARRDKAGNRS